MNAASIAAEYVELIGRPPEAVRWPDERFYPRFLPPRVFAFIQLNAREQTGRPLPKEWEPHRATVRHQCYATAAHGALTHPELTYNEGVDFHDEPFPIPHAWLTDRDGQVVELSARDMPDAYFGLPVPTSRLRRLLSDGIARPVLPDLIAAGWNP